MSTAYKTIRIYTSEYKRHPWYFCGALLMGPGFVLQNIISPLFVARILSELASKGPVNTANIWYALLALSVGASLYHFGDRYCSMKLSAITIASLHTRCMRFFLDQDYSFFADNFTGSLVTAANRLAKDYELFSNQIFLEMLGIWCGVIAAVGIMMYYNLLLGSVVGTFWVLSIIIVFVLVNRRIPIRRFAVAKESEMTGELADDLTNIISIKTFAKEKEEAKRYNRSGQELFRRLTHSWSRAISNHFLVQILCIALQMIVLIGGITSVRHGSLSIALFLLFQLYSYRIIDSIIKASQEMRQIEGIFGNTAEMTELLDRLPEINDPVQPEASRISRGAINFNHIRFDYLPTKQQRVPLFKEFNLTIAAGEKVGLVGPSGGGKTTLTKLLLRFKDVQSGSIEIDGQDIRHITQDDLHRGLSYVPQEPLLFHRTIQENIGYGLEKVSIEKVMRAAKLAHADEFISELEHGYDTLVGERGIKLSGGQRQRIAIARTMLMDSPILILDEATAALDSQSETYIQASLKKLMEHKTTLVIAHRLSTIQKLDRIIVIDKGTIVEEGSHKQLLEKHGLYATLWKHQSGGFIDS